MDRTNVQTRENNGLLAVIREVMKESTGYKVVNVIHIVLRVLVWIAAIVTAIVSLLLNGAFELLTNIGQNTDVYANIFEVILRSCGPLFTIFAVYTMLVSTPFYSIKQWIIRKSVVERGYDVADTVTSFRYKLAHANERKTTKEAFLENVGWGILSYEYGSKNLFVRFFRFLLSISFYISTAIILIVFRVLLALWSLDLLSSISSNQWSSTGSIAFLVVVFVFFWGVGKLQTNGRKKLLDKMQQGLKKEEEVKEEEPEEEEPKEEDSKTSVSE